MKKKLMNDTKNTTVNVIGAGLAGCEAAYALAVRGVNVRLYEMKPAKFTPAHSNADFAELVCSNSLKNNSLYNACGLLKQEMRELGSLIIKIADETSVPAGEALAVNRELFAKAITEKIKSEKNIEVITGEVSSLNPGEISIIATGPLTSENLLKYIAKITGNGNLYFFDAAAPIVDGATIDAENAFVCDRYGRGTGDYLNCPMDKEQYRAFTEALLSAETIALKSFEDGKVFEGCMPVEVMAKRGFDTLRYGPLKPVGLTDPKTGRMPYAVLQLRRENLEGSFYNMVGFQTNLKFAEQKRVFSMIPALKNAVFVKYGVMHRNSYINSPALLDGHFRLKLNPDIYFVGQISGVEGYVESAASGLMCALNAVSLLSGREMPDFTAETMCGALAAYISSEKAGFQPMNANYAIIKPLEKEIGDKKSRYKAYAERSLNKIKSIKEKYQF